MMSLRGMGTRYVAVGNIFSGLFCPVREHSTRDLEIGVRCGRRSNPAHDLLDSNEVLESAAGKQDELAGHRGFRRRLGTEDVDPQILASLDRPTRLLKNSPLSKEGGSALALQSQERMHKKPTVSACCCG